MAAVARARDGRTVEGVNVYHFTGGPCAELVVLGAAVAQGMGELDTIVAVGDRDRGVLPPCGCCRQVLLDLHPRLRVILGSGGALRAVPVADLLPERYVRPASDWASARSPSASSTRFPNPGSGTCSGAVHSGGIAACP